MTDGWCCYSTCRQDRLLCATPNVGKRAAERSNATFTRGLATGAVRSTVRRQVVSFCAKARTGGINTRKGAPVCGSPPLKVALQERELPLQSSGKHGRSVPQAGSVCVAAVQHRQVRGHAHLFRSGHVRVQSKRVLWGAARAGDRVWRPAGAGAGLRAILPTPVHAQLHRRQSERAAHHCGKRVVAADAIRSSAAQRAASAGALLSFGGAGRGVSAARCPIFGRYSVLAGTVPQGGAGDGRGAATGGCALAHHQHQGAGRALRDTHAADHHHAQLAYR
eukprot:ctg_808.g273